MVLTALRAVFINRHGELRAGWRMGLFVLVLSVLSAAALGLLALLDVPLRGPLPQAALVLTVLAASWFMTRFVNHKPLGAVGITLHPRMFYDSGMGLVLGFAMMAGIVLVELALGYVSFVGRQPSLSAAVAGVGSLGVDFALGAAFEELLFRGYLFQTCIQGVGFLPATALFSGLFALAHAGNPGMTWMSSLNIVLAGVWLSLAYMRTRSLWFPTALHFGWNFSQSAIFSHPTSGLAFADRVPFVLEQSGPAWLTGGAFGPEGGALASLAIVLSMWHMLKSRRYDAPEGIITLDSLEDILPGNGHARPGEEP